MIRCRQHRRAAAVLQRLLAALLLLLPLSTTIYLRALAISPLAYLSTGLFVATLATFVAVAVSAAKVHPDECTEGETRAALPKTSLAQRSSVYMYCPLTLYALGNVVLVGWVLLFNSRVDDDLRGDLAQTAVGAVSESSARIWIRAPSHSVACVTARSDNDGTTVTGWNAIDSSADHTTVVKLVGLQASHKYTYDAIPCGLGGASLPDSQVVLGSGEFRIFPAANESVRAASIRFAMGSCTMIGRTAYRTLRGIRRMHDTHPDFYLFLGDVIYADIPKVSRGLGSGSTALSLYYGMYRETLANSDFAALRASVPGFYQIDDHEILNDFEVSANTLDVYNTALTAWQAYIGSMNPPARAVASSGRISGSPDEDEPGALYYSFQAGPHTTFFVLDTRSYRYRGINQTTTEPAARCQDAVDSSTDSHTGSETHTREGRGGTMLGKHQGAAVRRWLQESQENGVPFKFLSSPQPWSRNAPPHGEHCSEGWSGHLAERDALLDWIADAKITGTVFLSGDLHQCGVFELRPGMFEVTASPFDASGQITDHAAGTLERTIFSQHHYNQAFALISVVGTLLRLQKSLFAMPFISQPFDKETHSMAQALQCREIQTNK